MGLFDFWKKRRKKAVPQGETAELSGVDPGEIVPPETRYTPEYQEFLAAREAEERGRASAEEEKNEPECGGQAGPQPFPEEENKEVCAMKTQVTYFSAGGVTAGVAKRLADAIGAPIYEIRPAVPYTAEDLNWRNQDSRSSLEMKDKACRPALADTDAPVAEAELVFLGYPVWWYREPSVIDTFLEAYDFKGKKIVLFATSGTSGIGDEAPARVAELTGAEVLPGKRFPAEVSGDELKAWAEGF